MKVGDLVIITCPSYILMNNGRAVSTERELLGIVLAEGGKLREVLTQLGSVAVARSSLSLAKS